ncbi:MAG: hypothetical protein JXR25_11970 [Pontiellaceae bacterium]|nr:hypothetical protein [Pontiellaceae bacterium]MBN2785530.1 hypothetical protein [Pontiellaceae bacterium]
MKPVIKLDISSMSGMGPAAWDQDHNRMSLHLHAHPVHHGAVQKKETCQSNGEFPHKPRQASDN